MVSSRGWLTAQPPQGDRASRARVVCAAFGSLALSGCSSSTSSGPPSCPDTSAVGTRLAAGCVHDGKTYEVKTFTR